MVHRKGLDEDTIALMEETERKLDLRLMETYKTSSAKQARYLFELDRQERDWAGIMREDLKGREVGVPVLQPLWYYSEIPEKMILATLLEVDFHFFYANSAVYLHGHRFCGHLLPLVTPPDCGKDEFIRRGIVYSYEVRFTPRPTNGNYIIGLEEVINYLDNMHSYEQHAASLKRAYSRRGHGRA